jgi:hypothetical protein
MYIDKEIAGPPRRGKNIQNKMLKIFAPVVRESYLPFNLFSSPFQILKNYSFISSPRRSCRAADASHDKHYEYNIGNRRWWRGW